MQLYRTFILGLLITLTIPSFGCFTIENISNDLAKQMISTQVWNDSAPVHYTRLRLLTVCYFDFTGTEHVDGKLVVLDACAEEIINIFRELYSQKFPIAEISLMDKYNGDDNCSMSNNNTSCYNCRPIVNSNTISLHAYGVAIDLNPVQNPYISFNKESGTATYKPIAGVEYANRMLVRLGKPNRQGMAEQVLDIFARNGFYYWGGYWDTPIDYQHFQVSRSLTEVLAFAEPITAKIIFQAAVVYFQHHHQPLEIAIEEVLKETSSNVALTLLQHYQKDKEKFMDAFRKLTTS